MPRFRTDLGLARPGSAPLSTDAVRQLLAEVFRPAHFFRTPGLSLEWEHAAGEESAWEVFRGRLLDQAHSRQRCVFEAWNLYQKGPEGRAAEPLLSLKLDEAAGAIHVVRGLDSYVWEGFDAGGNVYLSRERRKWVRELVGSIELGRFTDVSDLHDELICRLFHAVVGSGRLPLTSVEAPLPAFSFGELFYSYRPGAPAGDGPLGSHEELVTEMLG